MEAVRAADGRIGQSGCPGSRWPGDSGEAVQNSTELAEGRSRPLPGGGNTRGLAESAHFVDVEGGVRADDDGRDHPTGGVEDGGADGDHGYPRAVGRAGVDLLGQVIDDRQLGEQVADPRAQGVRHGVEGAQGLDHRHVVVGHPLDRVAAFGDDVEHHAQPGAGGLGGLADPVRPGIVRVEGDELPTDRRAEPDAAAVAQPGMLRGFRCQVGRKGVRRKGQRVDRGPPGDETGDVEPFAQVARRRRRPPYEVVRAVGVPDEADEGRSDAEGACRRVPDQPSAVDEFGDDGVCGGARHRGLTHDLGQRQRRLFGVGEEFDDADDPGGRWRRRTCRLTRVGEVTYGLCHIVNT